MEYMYTESALRGMPLANRLVRSAINSRLADEKGLVTEKHIALYRSLAKGGAGMIITGQASVSREGVSGSGQLAAWSEESLAGWRELTAEIHLGGAKAVLQISHCGVLAKPPHAANIVGPSDAGSNVDVQAKALTEAEIASLVEGFAEAAGMAVRAGFDAVQIHAAHTYLLGQFLSPHFNRRNDEYGGSLDNRARFLLQIVEAVRHRVGDAIPILVKLNSEDYLEKGLTPSESRVVAVMLENASVDAIEISGGSGHPDAQFGPFRPGRIREPAQEAYYRNAADYFKERLHIPVILVGGIRTPQTAETLLRNGTADYIALGRPLICQPDLPGQWRSGQQNAAQCISDNLCFKAGSSGAGVYCATFDRKTKH